MSGHSASLPSQLGRLIYQLYSIRVIILLGAVLLIVLPERPAWLQITDQWLVDYLADDEQRRLIMASETEAVGQQSRSFLNIGLSDVWKSVEDFGSEILPETNREPASLTPGWFVFADPLLLLAGCGLLLFAAPRMSLSTSAVVVLGTAVALLLLQAAQLRWWSTWFPLGSLICFLVLGYLAMLLWLKSDQKLRFLLQSRHELALAHSRLLIPQDRGEEAYATLRLCKPNAEMLATAYELAQHQEQCRQYAAAIQTYSMIRQIDARYRDVVLRLRELNKSQAPQSASQTATNLDATVVMESPVRKTALGRYEIERELGRGAMGVVYLGRDPKIAREVAIKTLNYQNLQSHQVEELRERFFREASAAGRLNHPNIVTVYDVGEESDLAYIAMDYIQGEPLDRYCRADRLLPVASVYSVILQVAEALDYAHQRNIVHRDIKPSNLIYDTNTGQVKVSDFGIARISDESQTRTGQVMGSPLYMSPEQLKGKKITGAADLFSLGATFYQLLTGATPFSADNLPELTIQIMSKKHRSVREVREDLPPSAVRITNKALQKDPSKRYASAAEMVEQLRKALDRELKGLAA